MRVFIFCLILLSLCISESGALQNQHQSSDESSNKAPDQWSKQDKEALDRITIPEGVEKRIIAAAPLVRDPVAFGVDAMGRAYICESERQEFGVEDNRSSPYWLQDDLALQTVDDRMAMYEKHKDRRENGMEYYTAREDRLTCLSDSDGDGIMDTVRPFTDPFAEPLDGTLAGVLVEDGTAWITNIPHLWIATDADQDGRAESRRSAQRGFGVRIALRGHDMHGLVRGPDGRIYFSIGDRGFYLETTDGRLMHDAGSGAVFRCEPDGSDLELVHVGLRNPQELAFNEYGDLFTGDNNSDAGDQARIVQILPGGETGWRMEYQTLEGSNQRGPWNQEGIWQVDHPVRPRWALPPITHLGSGPSGLVFHPGTGFRSDLAGSFFMCDFRGDPAASLLWRFRLEQQGAGYRLSEKEKFIEGVLCTDVDFTPKGALWISAWGGGWVSTDRGRLFEFTESQGPLPNAEMSVEELLTCDLKKYNTDQLSGWVTLGMLLGHSDRRVRQRVQGHLASGGDKEADLLVSVAEGESDNSPLSRIHALWGLEQWLRKSPLKRSERLLSLAHLESDASDEVRRQLARVLGEMSDPRGKSVLIRLLEDPSPRVQSMAALGLGRLGAREAREELFQLGMNAGSKDAVLFHAAVMGLAGSCTESDLLVEGLASNSSRDKRLLALLALRKKHHPYWLFAGETGTEDSPSGAPAQPQDPRKVLQSGLRYRVAGDSLTRSRPVSPALAYFLNDPDPLVVTEAARGLHDLGSIGGLPRLADHLIRLANMSDEKLKLYGELIWPLGRRAIDAALRHGSQQHLLALVKFAEREALPIELREEALRAAEQWNDPPTREGVRGLVRPLADEIKSLRQNTGDVLEGTLDQLLAGSDLQGPALRVACTHQLPLPAETNRAVLHADGQRVEFRLQALDQIKLQVTADQLRPDLQKLSDSGDPLIKLRALELMEPIDQRPEFLMRIFAEGDSIKIRQLAIRHLVENYDSAPRVLDWLNVQLQSLDQEALEAALILDLLRACETSSDEDLAESALNRRLGKGEDRLADFHWALQGGDGDLGRQIFLDHPVAQCQRCHKKLGQGGVSGPSLEGSLERQTRSQILQSILDPSAVITEGYVAENGISAMPEVHWVLEPEELRDLLEFITES